MTAMYQAYENQRATCERLISGLDRVNAKSPSEKLQQSTLGYRHSPELNGICGVDLPLRVGGDQLPATLMMELFVACGRIGVDFRDVLGAGHARFLLGVQTRKFDNLLKQVAKGEAFVAIAITEEGAGSDMLGLKVTATPNGLGGYTLSGRTMFVSRLKEATHVIVLAQVQRGTQQLLTAFLIESSVPGLKHFELEPLGLRGVSFGGADLDHVTVSSSARIGGEGQAFILFNKHFAYWRTAMACVALGCARQAIDIATQRLRTREAFGGHIGRFTHLQQELARHAGAVHSSYLLVQNVAARIDQRLPAFVDAQLAKAEVVETSLSAVDFAMRLHGAMGITTLLDLEKRLRDLLCLRVADGTTDLLRTQVARALWGDILYDHSVGRSNQYRAEHPAITRRFW